MSFFSLPLLQWQQQQSVLTSRKRKSTSGGFDSDYPESEDAQSSADESAHNASTTVRSSSRRDGTTSDLSQHRVAGLGPDELVPRAPFPHGPVSNGRAGRRETANTEETLQSLNPPLSLPESFARGGSLRMQHFAVISTILHRCLLEGDYVRASRAWGMILRDEFGGFAVDPRADGRWGIGAEILLQRDAQAARAQDIITTASQGRDLESSAKPKPRPWFTREAFDAAQDYYERLILQYPFHRSYAKSIGELDFYPAMFGLWIYIAQAERSIAKELLEVDLSENGAKLHAEAEQDLVRRELKDAKDIAKRLDEVMTHPPYSDYGELLRLRGMAALWVGDLQASQEEAGSKEANADPSKMETDREEGSSRRKREAILVAKRFFEDAKRRGIELPQSIESLWESDDEGMLDG